MLSWHWKTGELSRCGQDCAARLLIERALADIFVRKALDLGSKDENSGDNRTRDLTKWLNHAGFTLLASYEGFTTKSPSPNSDRIQFVAQKR